MREAGAAWYVDKVEGEGRRGDELHEQQLRVLGHLVAQAQLGRVEQLAPSDLAHMEIRRLCPSAAPAARLQAGAALRLADLGVVVRARAAGVRPALGEQREATDAIDLAGHVRACTGREGRPLARHRQARGTASVAVDAQVEDDRLGRALALTRQQLALDASCPGSGRLGRVGLDEARLQLQPVLAVNDRLRRVGLAVVLGVAIPLHLILLARVPQLALRRHTVQRAPHQAGHQGRRVGARAQAEVDSWAVRAPH